MLASNGNNGSSVILEEDQTSRIRQLELELARVKLELVDAQCRNQEYDHKLKTVLNSANLSSQDSSNEGSSYLYRVKLQFIN